MDWKIGNFIPALGVLSAGDFSLGLKNSWTSRCFLNTHLHVGELQQHMLQWILALTVDVHSMHDGLIKEHNEKSTSLIIEGLRTSPVNKHEIFLLY